MPDDETPTEPIKAALFIDFDNVYGSLSKVSRSAAQRFARDPQRWLRWFEDGRHESRSGEVEKPRPRRILVRRCYLNPAVFGNERAAFSRNGFSVIDCPSLTSQGKNSADIYMVMDIMDVLHHKTSFGEFIILSSDADFTPVLVRLREYDRHSMIIGNAVAAAALKAACDFVVELDEFIEDALGIERGAESATPDPSVEISRPIPPSSPAIISTEQRTPNKESSGTNSTANRPDDVLKYVRACLNESPKPILLSTLGLKIANGVGRDIKEGGWCGYGSLSDLLRALEKVGGFALVISGSRSFVYDPNRHEPLPFEERDHLSGLRSEFAEFIDRMNKSIALPRFSPSIYRVLFQAIASSLTEGFGDRFGLVGQVVDKCRRENTPMTRQTIDFVLTCLSDVGFDFNNTPARSEEIAAAFRDNALSLCKNAQISISDNESGLMDQWLVGSQISSSVNQPRAS